MSQTAFIQLKGDALHLGNTHFEQRWQLRDASLHLVHFQLRGKAPWVDQGTAGAATSTTDTANTGGAISTGDALSTGDAPGTGDATQPPACVQSFTTETKRHHAAEAPSLNAYLALRQADDSLRHYHFQVFDSLSGCLLRMSATEEAATTRSTGAAAPTTKVEATSNAATSNAATSGAQNMGGIEVDPGKGIPAAEATAPAPLAAGALYPFLLARPHLEFTEVTFIEQSDDHSDFVFERRQQMHPSEKSIRTETNLILLEDPAGDEGIALLLLAPSPLVRKTWGGKAGYLVENLAPPANAGKSGTRLTATPDAYPLAFLIWEGGEAGREATLHQLQRVLHQWRSGRDGLFLSNTWGDRGRGDRISEAFITEEIAIGKQLGTDVIEIDDGWQSGITANTRTGHSGVWTGFWEASPTFWEPSPTAFPNGLAPVIAAAENAGMQFGLWFAPDSANDFANWHKDADVLLGLWRTHGVRFFKLDAIKLRSPAGERNLYRLLERVQDESEGAILLDMDLTAEHRLTYWGWLGGSTLFLQNRYTDWGNYYPHQTLRALWTLCAYVLPTRLRLEALNPERNTQLYANDPLQPAAYPPEYLLAITLPASGLGWFEHASLSEPVLRAWSSLLAVWKQHRERWHTGQVRRIGEAPNGFSWTGFISESKAGIYLLVFRERTACAQHRFHLPAAHATHAAPPAHPAAAQAPTEATLLAGSGKATLAGDGQSLVVDIPQSPQFLLAYIARSN